MPLPRFEVDPRPASSTRSTHDVASVIRRGLGDGLALLARLCRPALSRSGGICCSRLLRLIFLHESISLLSHAPPRRFVGCADVKIGMAEGYVALALLKQRRVVPDFWPSVLTQAISGLLVTQPKFALSVAITPTANIWRRRILFMG